MRRYKNLFKGENSNPDDEDTRQINAVKSKDYERHSPLFRITQTRFRNKFVV